MEVIRWQVEISRVRGGKVKQRGEANITNTERKPFLRSHAVLTQSLSITHSRTHTNHPIAPLPVYTHLPHSPTPIISSPPSALHALIYLSTPHLTLFPIGVPVVHHPFTRQSSDAITAAFDAALNTICASSSTTRHH